MNESSRNSSKASTGVVVAATIVALVFAVLWLRERKRKPTEVLREIEKPVQVIKEASVENIREVPKEVEVIKEIEVPAKLTDAEKFSIDFAARYFRAQTVKSKDEVFYKVDSVAVTVGLNDAIKKIVSEDRIKNKFELILRKHSIRLDENAPVWLSFSVEGLWDKDEVRLTYTPLMSLDEFVIIGRKNDLRRVIASTWREQSYGYAGKNVAEKAIMDAVEERAESFANKFLASRDKESEKETAK